jgi:catechol 2,3-dioxygenase-like lactoylglutathione lyase family enzyme
MHSMAIQERPIQALGEIVLRVKNLPSMQEFYENVIGLELLQRFDEQAVFFRIAPGYAGHTQVLALFAESIPPDHRSLKFSGLDAGKTTLHHIALAIGLADFAKEKERLEKLGLVVETQEFEWVHWRSLYVPDPEGNLVELVCYDASVQ